MLRIDQCRKRQKRLLQALADHSLDVALLTNAKTVYYFSGILVQAAVPHAFLLDASGKSLLVTHGPMGKPPEPPSSAADDVRLYEMHTIERDVAPSTWDRDVAGLLLDALREWHPQGARTGIEFESASFTLAEGLREWSRHPAANLTPAIDQMRRVKDEDELEAIRRCVQLVAAGLAGAKGKLEPGMTEYEAYLLYYRALVAEAGTSVPIGGDFASGVRNIRGGGPPTGRRIEKGDLFIFDTYPNFQGYFCDYTRAFAVSKPTQLQQDAWGHICEAFDVAERTIRPGVPAREVYEAVRSHLEKFEPARGSFWHHAGHGVGMSGWELPWLCPNSDHVIQEGEVLACEPALYSQELQGGIRLEHNYLVTQGKPVALDDFPLELT